MVSNLHARSHPVQVLPKTLLALSVPSQLIAKGLLLALLGTLVTPVDTRPLMASPVVQAQNTSATNTVAQRLVGRWQTTAPGSDEVITFIFAPDGNLFMLLPAPDGSSVAIKAGYQINPTPQPMQLDIQLTPKQKALTIFEFTPEGQLRVALDGLTPEQPRMTAFQPNATVFEKTSQATTVPEEIQVIELEAPEDSQSSQKPEDEAKKYLYALTQVQRAHYEEVGKFATAIEQVSIGLRTETESYRYQIVPQGNETQSVMITAAAKNSQLPSYTGAVFVTQVNGQTTTVAQICETNQPSTSPPAMPTGPRDGSSAIQCPTGSRSLQ